MKEASIITKIDYSTICECAKGTAKSAGGFLWRYKENTNDTK